MKAAICISGHLRNLEAGLVALKDKIITPNKDVSFDIFVDTWNINDWRRDESEIDYRSIQLIAKELQPKSIRIDSPFQPDMSKYNDLIRPGHVKKNSSGEHVVMMYHKIQQCFEQLEYYVTTQQKLKNASIWYDFVMRHRFDCQFLNDINFQEYQIKTGCIYVTKHKLNQNDWCSDVAAFGSYKPMKLYSSIAEKLFEYASEINTLRPEAILYHVLKSHHLIIEEINSDWKIL